MGGWWRRSKASVGVGSVGVALLLVGTNAYGATAVIQEVPGTFTLNSVACGNSHTCVAVGEVLDSNYASSAVAVPIESDTVGTATTAPGWEGFPMLDASCVNPNTCVAINDSLESSTRGGWFMAVTGTLPYGLSTLEVSDPVGSPALSSLACVSTNACLSVGNDPGGNVAMGAGVVASDAGADEGGALSVPGQDLDPSPTYPTTGNCSPQPGGFCPPWPVSVDILYGIACPTTASCLAVGEQVNNGETHTGIVVSISMDSSGNIQNIGAPITAPVAQPLSAIACANAETCVALSGTLNGAAVVPIVNGMPLAPITPADSSQLYLRDVACVSGGPCLASGDLHLNGGGETGALLPVPLGTNATRTLSPVAFGVDTFFTGVTCPTGNTCIVVGEAPNPVGSGNWIGLTTFVTPSGSAASG